MALFVSSRRSLGLVLAATLVFSSIPQPAGAQFLKRALQVGACAGAGYGGAKLGEKVAEAEARRLNLSAAELEKHKKMYMIGLGLALCSGGAFVAGTTYSRLSKRGQEARQREVLAALEDAQPRTYVDPENPSLQGTVVAQPTFVQGNEECRIVEDRLGGDEALIKYCRTPPDGTWSVKTV